MGTQNEPQKPKTPRQSQLDQERAAGEGMVQPEVEKEQVKPGKAPQVEQKKP